MKGPALKRPLTGGWQFIDEIQRLGAVRWRHESGLVCLSSVDVVEKDFHGSGVLGPHYHVSATMQAIIPPRSCTDQEIEQVRAAFEMGGAEEDNHGPGIARHLWLCCDYQRQPDCACKQDEDKIVEGPRVRHEAAEEFPS